jgi:hypothetical protein
VSSNDGHDVPGISSMLNKQGSDVFPSLNYHFIFLIYFQDFRIAIRWQLVYGRVVEILLE